MSIRFLTIKYLFLLIVYLWTAPVCAHEFLLRKTHAVSFLDRQSRSQFQLDWHEDLEEKIINMWNDPFYQETELLKQIQKKIKFANLRNVKLEFFERIILDILQNKIIYFNNLFNNKQLKKYLLQQETIKTHFLLIGFYSTNKVSDQSGYQISRGDFIHKNF